jgi:hypothetical protein
MAEAIHDKTVLHQMLKLEVEETFGRSISTARDSAQLSEDIYRKTNVPINTNTLRRFFGLVKAAYPPSASTVNILAKYCGYNSAEELYKLRGKLAADERPYKTVELLRYFVSVFQHAPVPCDYNDLFRAQVRQALLFMQLHPALANRFQKEIARLPSGQSYYFEQFVNIDQLNSYYGIGLRNYLSEKKTAEAQIFGNALLCLKSWLTRDVTGVKRFWAEQEKYSVTPQIHPFVRGRHYASQLFYAAIHSHSFEAIIKEAQKMHNTPKDPADAYASFPAFELTFTIGLILVECYAEALYFLEYAEHHYPRKHALMEEGYYETLDLLNAIALLKTGKKAEALAIFKKLQPQRFAFITKKFNSLFYLLLAGYLNRTNEKLEDQFRELVSQTGFVRFEDLRN